MRNSLNSLYGRGLSLVLFVCTSLIVVSHGGAAVTIEQAVKTVEGLSAAERLARIEDAARKEGRVRWSSSIPVTRAETIFQGFRKKYPGIQVEFDRLSGRVLADRVIREYRSGKHDVDVLGSSAVTVLALKDAGVIGSYSSPEAAGVKSGAADPKGFWTAHYSNVLANICNKNRVKAAPQDWKEFAQSKWKGDFSVDVERFQWFLALSRIYGDDAARKLFQGYVQNGAQIRRGGTLQSQLVAAGEYSCALAVYLDNVYVLLKAGAPIVYSVPEPVLLSPDILMVGKFPPHPYASVLLYDYLLSYEGLSHLTRNHALFPPRGDAPVVDEVGVLQPKTLHFIDVEDQSRSYKESLKSYQSILRR
ncbi:MAG: ABC transporter substrate-binding protein [Deltaproteobacteria bacterium]|nr:ABC transporter substrate-binding protein [Deltaproteobacteria bacterium]